MSRRWFRDVARIRRLRRIARAADPGPAPEPSREEILLSAGVGARHVSGGAPGRGPGDPPVPDARHATGASWRPSPVAGHRVIEPPVIEPPVIEPPVTEPPVIEPPVIEPPVTEPPVTEPPSTGPALTGPALTATVDEARPPLGLRPSRELGPARRTSRFEPAVDPRPGSAPAAPSRRSWRGHICGLTGMLSGLAAVLLLSWHLGRPALWLDESASVLAERRSWAGLGALMQGNDAPLVAYYALLKSANRVMDLVPGWAPGPEVSVRWLSVAGLALGVTALAAWLSRRHNVELAVYTVAILLLTTGFSRYGQEGRPYALMVLLAAVATVLWDRLATSRRWVWPVLYALSMAAISLMHAIAATLIVAHLVASLVAVGRGNRRRTFLVTGIFGAIGIAATAPFQLAAIAHGTGAGHYWSITPLHLLGGLTPLYFTENPPLVAVLVFSGLVLIGVTQVRHADSGWLARVALCWAVVPALVMLALVPFQHNLLISRYSLFTLPGWAILAALGVYALAGWVLAVAYSTRLRRLPRWIPPVVALATATVLVVTVAATQQSSLTQVRATDGHGEDVRTAIARAQAPDAAGLPIVVNTHIAAMEIEAYEGQDVETDRLVGVDRTPTRFVWPTLLTTTDAYAAELAPYPKVVLLLRSKGAAKCRLGPATTLTNVRQCMPLAVRDLGYEPVDAEHVGARWMFAVLERRGA